MSVCKCKVYVGYCGRFVGEPLENLYFFPFVFPSGFIDCELWVAGTGVAKLAIISYLI